MQISSTLASPTPCSREFPWVNISNFLSQTMKLGVRCSSRSSYVLLTQKLCTARPCPASILMRPALVKWRWGWRACLYCLRRLWFLPWRVEAISTEIKLTGRKATSCPPEQSARQSAEVDVYIIISHLYWSLARPIV